MRAWPKQLPLQKLLIEVFSIVLGVLLALAINQWREARANRALAETALASAAYSIAAGTQIDEQRKLEEFSAFLELLIAIEGQLLIAYEDALAAVEASRRL